MLIFIFVYVQQVDGNIVQVVVLDVDVCVVLQVFGVVGQVVILCVEVGDDIGKVCLFVVLCDWGVVFLVGCEWSLVEVFVWFCDRGLFEGLYLCIVWIDLWQYVVCIDL